MRGLTGKRILIAGCATGIGAATVERLASEGARFFLGDVNAPGMAAVAEDARARGGDVATRVFDLTDVRSIEALVAAAADRLGGLDGAANVAAVLAPEIIGADGPLLEMDTAIWDLTLRANLIGVAALCRHALPHLIAAGGGAIVNVSSGATWYGEPTRPAYAASKAGINALTRHIARAYGGRNVRANSVSPGFTMTKNAQATTDEAFLAFARASLSLTRLGEPPDQAAAIAFLLSDDAAWVTGQVWNVSGGGGADGGGLRE